MVTFIACDKNSSSSHTGTFNPNTKEEFEKCLTEFETSITNIFSRWYLDIDDSDATEEQQEWINEIN